MFLKRRVRKKDGKAQVHYARCESLRVHSGRVVQRQVLHLGELNTTQTERWQRTLEIINEEDGARLQRRLFADREGAAPEGAEDVVEVRLASLRVRAHWPGQSDPAALWATYIPLTEAEAAFRSLKSEIKVRPIWHWKESRVDAHILVACLGYAMWVCLKKLAAAHAPSLTPWQVLTHLRAIIRVDVEFDTRDGRRLVLPRITEPGKEQAALLLALGWRLPEQPPPRIRAAPPPEP